MTDRRPPRGYEPPHPRMRTKYTHYYLEPQVDYDGPTPLFMVTRLSADGERILAERCLIDDATSIVDALSLAYTLDTWGPK